MSHRGGQIEGLPSHDGFSQNTKPNTPWNQRGAGKRSRQFITRYRPIRKREQLISWLRIHPTPKSSPILSSLDDDLILVLLVREKRITVWRPAAQLLHSTIIQFPHTALHRRLIIPRARSSPYLCDKIPVILKQTSGFASFQHSFESSHAHDLNSESGNFSRQNQALEEGAFRRGVHHV